MRAKLEATYRLTALPPVPEVLAYLVEAGGMDPREAYGTLNMGVGLGIFVRPGHGGHVVELAQEAGFNAMLAGWVEEGLQRVVLEPVDLEFASFELALPLSRTSGIAGEPVDSKPMARVAGTSARMRSRQVSASQ